MLTFLKNIGRSVYDPTFYKELEGRSVWLSLRYYVGLSAWVAFFLGLVATAELGPLVLKFMSQAEPVVRDLYPKELVVTVKAGSAASNVAEPYAIKIPKEIEQFFGTTSPRSLVTIDTKSDAEPGRFLSQDTFILIARDGIMVMAEDRGKKTRTEFQKYTGDFVMTHDVYARFIDRVIGFGDKLPFVMMAVLVLGFFLWGLLRLVYFVPVGALVYLLLKSRGMPAQFAHAYRITIHAATLPILINFVLAFATGDIAVLALLPFLFTIILLAVVWCNLRDMRVA